MTSDLRMKLRDFFPVPQALARDGGAVRGDAHDERLAEAGRGGGSVFGGWARNMPVPPDAPRQFPGLLSAHLRPPSCSPRGSEDVFANPIKRDCLFIVEKGLIATRGRIQPVGTLLGIERLFRDPNDQRGEPMARDHPVPLRRPVPRRDALMGVVAEFPKVRRNMRKIVVRVVFRRAVVRHARAVVASARGWGRAAGRAPRRSRGSSASRATTGRARRNPARWPRLPPRTRSSGSSANAPRRHASMQNAATMVQRTPPRAQGAPDDERLRAGARAVRAEGALELHALLFALGMQHHAPEFAAETGEVTPRGHLRAGAVPSHARAARPSREPHPGRA